MNKGRRKLLRRRGVTTLEMLIGLSLTALVLLAGVIALVSTMQAWYRGEARIQMELASTRALQYIRDRLREAMSVSVDIDGREITYRLPERDLDGKYKLPPEWDGVERRIYVDANGQLISLDGERQTVLLDDVVFTDRRGGAEGPLYRPFTSGGGAIVRQVTVHLVTKKMLREEGEAAYGRVRETILLRNTPSIQL